MKIISQKYGYKPLAVTASRVFLSKGRKIYVSDHDLQNIRYFARIPFRRRRDVFAGLRAVDRVLRLSINTMIAVSDRVGYLNVGADIWRVDLQNGSVTLDFDIPHGRKALTLTVLPNFKGNETTIVFGDYFPNGSGPMLGQGKKGPKTGQVHIWMRTHDDEVSTAPQWQLLDKFDDNTVDHIHAIVSAPDGSDIFALVGDIGENVGFWKWNQDQNNFQPHRVGKQIYRSTWAAVRKGHLIYATDTQLEQNFLILLRDGQSRVEMIAQIEGSSIYASPVKGGVLFSST
ncbi:hypothetical protein N9J71_05115, partial [Ascidiaceihabitans sp.]